MLEPYQCHTADDYKNAIKEIVQEIALLGLYRGGFYNRAALYGGTALRIFHGVERFSEDLDFSLIEPDRSLNLLFHRLPPEIGFTKPDYLAA